jgi:hypothetical protein
LAVGFIETKKKAPEIVGSNLVQRHFFRVGGPLRLMDRVSEIAPNRSKAAPKIVFGGVVDQTVKPCGDRRLETKARQGSMDTYKDLLQKILTVFQRQTIDGAENSANRRQVASNQGFEGRFVLVLDESANQRIVTVG